jgi:uncharacterized protein YdeI (YjbR/CyaY-like superfamily)
MSASGPRRGGGRFRASNVPMRPRYFLTPAEFRKWFQTHHNKAGGLLVGFRKRTSGRRSITWPEAVDQALCFGWIDGVRRSLDEASYCIRFTPRKAAAYGVESTLRGFGNSRQRVW